MTINTVDSYRHNAEKTYRGYFRASTEKNAEKRGQVVAEQEAKKDSVEISEDGRAAAERNQNIRLMTAADFSDEFLQKMKEGTAQALTLKGQEIMPSFFELDASNLIFDALNGKIGEAGERRLNNGDLMMAKIGESTGNNGRDAASLLGSMLLGKGEEDNLETRAENREAAKNLAKHIAETYFTDPEEAQSFLDMINELADASEALDKGYATDSLFSGNPISEWYKSDKEDRGSLTSFLELKKPLPMHSSGEYRWTETGIKGWAEAMARINKQVEENSKKFWNTDPKLIEDRLKALDVKQSPPDQYEYYNKLPEDFSEEGAWDKVVGYLSYWGNVGFQQAEATQAWYADFMKNEQTINNAKLITDFSGNQKWNIVMKLLS